MPILGLRFCLALPLPSFRQPFHSTSKSKVQVPLSPTFSSRYNRKFLSLRTLISIYVYIILHSPPHIPIPHRWLFFPLQGGGPARPPRIYVYTLHVFYPPEEEAGKLSTVSLVSRPETCFGLLAELGACLISSPPPPTLMILCVLIFNQVVVLCFVRYVPLGKSDFKK